MQAVLIATGEDSKLSPITKRVPSPMLPVMNRPIMLYNLELLGRLGFKQILVSVYTMANSIERYFGDGQKWGLSLKYIVQREALGSAGALWRARRLIKEPFLVMPAHMVADLEIGQAIQRHLDQRAQATVVVKPGTYDGCQTLVASSDGRILALGDGRASDLPNCTNTGIYLFHPEILDCIPPHSPFEIDQHLLPVLFSKEIPVHACLLPGYWNPLDNLQRYAEAQHVFLSKTLKDKHATEEKTAYQYHSVDTRQIGRGIWMGRNNKIHPDVKIIPPVNVGHSTWIEREVELGPCAVIGSNVIIDQGATIRHSTVFDNTYVGKLVNVDNRLVDQDQLIDLTTTISIQVNNPILLGKVNSQFIVVGFKHFMDCFLALVLLLINSLLILVIAFLLLLSTGKVFTKIRCWSPRSFYWRDRSINTEPFELLHFHTHNEDGSLSWLGGWLERLELKRLPELLNVLRGDLSIVGLKPVVTESGNTDPFDLQLENEDVPAGITGLWYTQVDDENSPEESLIADTYYLATRCFKNDWQILWRTPAAMCRRIKRHMSTGQNP